jgi:pimeloyl-ACP methyl ester carboxylesterase
VTPYVDLGGVRSWYDERGAGDPLVFMHGALVDSRFYDQNIEALAEHFHVFSHDRRGHGRTADVEDPMTFEAMVDDNVALLEEVVGGPAHLVGHSNGAFTALLTALRRPDLVRRLVMVSGGFHRDGLVSEEPAENPDAPLPDLAAAYGEVSPEGKDHFQVLMDKTVALDSKEPALPQARLRDVTARTLLMFGDDDLVTIEHIEATYRGIPDAELAVVPGTSHFLLQEKPALCNRIIADFLLSGPVPTVAPIRRARRRSQASGCGPGGRGFESRR